MDVRDPELEKEHAPGIRSRRGYESEPVDSSVGKVNRRPGTHVEQRVRREFARQ